MARAAYESKMAAVSLYDYRLSFSQTPYVSQPPTQNPPELATLPHSHSGKHPTWGIMGFRSYTLLGVFSIYSYKNHIYNPS